MHGSALLIAGLVAGGALAAPTTGTTALSKRHFKVPVKGSRVHGLSPKREMHRIFAKYGWLDEGLTPFGDDEVSTGKGVKDAKVMKDAVANIFGPAPTVKAAPLQTSATPLFKADNTTTAGPTATSGTATSTKGDGVSAEVTSEPEQNNSEYLTPVTVGGQELTLNFDTGSADLWVFSSKQASDEQGAHSIYTPTSNYEELANSTWKITYGDGSGASGVVGYDTVAVGAATATRQAIELATEVSAQFERDTNSDGLLGLAFSNINTVKVNGIASQQKTFFENVMGELDEPLFSVDLNEEDGTYEFGAIDLDKYAGDLHYVDINNSKGFWQFPSAQYSVNGTTKQNTAPHDAIVDTGTSLLLADSNVVRAFYAQVKGAKLDRYQGGYVYPCNSTLPDFGVKVGDYMVPLSGAHLTYAAIDTAGTNCFGGIQSNSGANVQIFGDVLFRQTYAVFDGGNLRFGIAPKN